MPLTTGIKVTVTVHLIDILPSFERATRRRRLRPRKRGPKLQVETTERRQLTALSPEYGRCSFGGVEFLPVAAGHENRVSTF